MLFGLSGLLGAARGIGRPRGGRVLAIVSGIGVLLGMAVVVVAVNLRPDPGAEQYLTILLAVTAVILVALFGERYPDSQTRGELVLGCENSAYAQES